jgi:hypothetical protein
VDPKTSSFFSQTLKEKAMSQQVSFRILCVFALLAILVAACGSGQRIKDQIIGKWEGNDPKWGGAVTFEFMKDNKATLSVNGVSQSIGYTWDDADTIEIAMGSGGKVIVDMWSVKIEGNKLSLTRLVDSKTMELTRK